MTEEDVLILYVVLICRLLRLVYRLGAAAVQQFLPSDGGGHGSKGSACRYTICVG